MIDFLTSPLIDSAAAHPALLWILGITIFAVGSVLMRDCWRWFIALGQCQAVLVDGDEDSMDIAAETSVETSVPAIAPSFDRRSPANPSTVFGRRRTDRIGVA